VARPQIREVVLILDSMPWIEVPLSYASYPYIVRMPYSPHSLQVPRPRQGHQEIY